MRAAFSHISGLMRRTCAHFGDKVNVCCLGPPVPRVLPENIVDGRSARYSRMETGPGRRRCGRLARGADVDADLRRRRAGDDIGVWYRTARAMQNAADAAAVAAARDSGNTTWNGTGQAVAARYGFINGADGIRVQIARDQTCPTGGINCFKASIHDDAAPQFFSKVLGVPAPPLSASATASLTAGSSLRQDACILALATSGTSPAVRTNGAPFADLNPLQYHVEHRHDLQRPQPERRFGRCCGYQQRLRQRAEQWCSAGERSVFRSGCEHTANRIGRPSAFEWSSKPRSNLGGLRQSDACQKRDCDRDNPRHGSVVYIRMALSILMEAR